MYYNLSLLSIAALFIGMFVVSSILIRPILKIIRNFTKVNLKKNKRNKNFDLPLIKCIFKLNLIHIILII
jgi:hypothetical protein